MSRDRILSGIRGALGAKEHDPARLLTVGARLNEPVRHPTPQRSLKPADELRAQFVQYLKAQSATVVELVGRADVPRTVVGLLREFNLPQRIRMGADARLAEMPWAREPGLEVSIGPTRGDADVTLSYAFAGVAETGTLALLSGPDNPVTLSFLPETHIVAIDASSIVGPYEDVFELMRERLGRRVMPRTLNFISGASRTADIGGKIVIGAHGPRRLVVLLIGGAPLA